MWLRARLSGRDVNREGGNRPGAGAKFYGARSDDWSLRLEFGG